MTAQQALTAEAGKRPTGLARGARIVLKIGSSSSVDRKSVV